MSCPASATSAVQTPPTHTYTHEFGVDYMCRAWDMASSVRVLNHATHPVRPGTRALERLRISLEVNRHSEQIVVGDFNLHHELWGGSDIRRTDTEAIGPIDLMDDFDLTSRLPPRTITYKQGDRRTTIDLCLTTVGLVDKLIRCEVEEGVDHDSDHLPIVTSLSLDIAQLQQQAKRNWKAIDETAFTRALRDVLPTLQRPRTWTAFDRYVEQTVQAVNIAIDDGVPAKIYSPWVRTGWNDECTKALAETKRLWGTYSQEHTEGSWEAYRAARNQKGRAIRKALRKMHREKVQEAAQSPASLWKLAKWTNHFSAAQDGSDTTGG